MEQISKTTETQAKPRLDELYAQNDFVLSFELFPPKTEVAEQNLREELPRLLKYRPHYITCTYGAGGSTRDKTLETLSFVQGLTDLPVASHLTCVGGTKDELRDYLRRATNQGINYIVAIRGDAPKGKSEYRPVDGGLRYGCDLVRLIRQEFPHFGIVVGGYPETHPEAPNRKADLDHLKHKVDCGADVVTTQLFYTNADYFRFRDECRAIGITKPIVPGLLPVTNLKQIKRITSMCGANLPEAFVRELEACGDDADRAFEVGTRQATRQAKELVEHGVPGIHFYVLNKSQATARVLEALDLSL